MCGIAGFVLDEINPEAPSWLTRMIQRLYHRGPDDGGAVVFGMNGEPCVERRLGRPDDPVDWSYVPAKIGLAARRLAVLDLTEAGQQPMASSDRRVWLVYNGEIYNHTSLREDLKQQGKHFKGHCDTEVLLAGYRAWGTEIFHKLQGMFAAAIVDWAAGSLVLARDRYGIKPLYLSRFANGLAFASEIKSLLALPGGLQGINETALRDFLCDGRIDHTEETLFDGIWAVPPGCFVELDLRARGTMHGGGAVFPYWNDTRPESGSGTLELLQDAVGSHADADVPIGSCLSGGIDSSAVVTVAYDCRRGPVAHPNLTQHTFTASLPGSELDETRYAQMVIDACDGLNAHFAEPSAARLARDIEQLMWHQEQPFGSPSIYMQWEVMRLAREQGMTVVLDGQGGDELFCGYEGHIPWYLAHLLSHGRMAKFVSESRAARRGHFSKAPLLQHVAAGLLPEATRDRFRLRGFLRSRPWVARELFRPEPSPGLCASLDLAPPSLVRGQDGSALSRRLWNAILRDGLPALLRFEDRNSMAFSIEARVPFLDKPLVDHAMRQPIEDKIHNGELKSGLRRALKGLVPDAILQRRDKIGFSAPTAAWMRGELEEWWRDRIASKTFGERGCFDLPNVRKLVERFEAGDDTAALEIWRAALVEEWARGFLDG